jgi:hypothetical protein
LPLPVATPVAGAGVLGVVKACVLLVAVPLEGVSCDSMAASAGFKVEDALVLIDMLVSVAGPADRKAGIVPRTPSRRGAQTMVKKSFPDTVARQVRQYLQRQGRNCPASIDL